MPARGGTIAVQLERATSTRLALISAARSIFGTEGFHASRTVDIVERAGLTRGALYHHFRDKVDLFEAVFRETTANLDRLGRAAVAGWTGDGWSKVQAALSGHLALVAANREFQQILLLDGPAILGWSQCRDIQSQFIARDMSDALEQLAEQGVLAANPPARLANHLQAALNDAALSIAHSADPEASSKSELAALSFLLDSLRR